MLRYMKLFLLIALLAPAGWAADVEPLVIGEKAIPFELPGVDGETHTLADYSDHRYLVLIFTCNHCPTAQAYEGRIKDLVRDYEDRGVQVVAISPNDDKAVRLDELGYTDVNDSLEEMKYRAEMMNFNFPYLYGGEATGTMKAYGPQATPHVFIFDEERRLRYRGRIDDKDNPAEVTSKDTRNALDALLAGEDVPDPTTKTFGCSIKWPDKREQAEQAMERLNQETAELSEIDVAGVKALMKNDTDKVRLINVWATWCGPCVIEFPDLVETYRMYRHRDFEFVTISADSTDNREDVKAFLDKYHASGTNYLFAGDDVYELIEAVNPDWGGSVPYTLILKPGGEIYYTHEGLIDPLEVRGKIVELLGRTYY